MNEPLESKISFPLRDTPVERNMIVVGSVTLGNLPAPNLSVPLRIRYLLIVVKANEIYECEMTS